MIAHPIAFSTHSPLVVLHALGDTSGGTPWAEAFTSAAWVGPTYTPDIFGHGTAAAPLGGNYDLADPAFLIARTIPPTPIPVVVGVGASGWAAQLLALGGRAQALVLVDGLGAPWLEPAEQIAADRALFNAILDDPASLAQPQLGAPDPRLVHGIRPHGSRRLAERAAAATVVPVLVIETPDSTTAGADAAHIAGLFGAGSDLDQVASSDPIAVAARVTRWAAGFEGSEHG